MDGTGQQPPRVRESRDKDISGFSREVLKTCKQRHLLGCSDSVLVALSGGADSTALLAALVDLRRVGEIQEVTAAHVDHGLRAGSHLDADRCAEVCDALGVVLRRVEVSVRRGNVQAEARRARYGALRREAAAVGATRIATGHTQDDQAETVILRLLRGAGARGLAAIPPRRGIVVRPILDRSRADVVAFLRERGLPSLEDPSNATPRFLRNRVRAEVLPRLRELAPEATRSLSRAADLLRDDEKALEALGRRLVVDGTVRVDALRLAPVAVRRRAVRELWRLASGRRAGLDSAHVEAVLALLPARRPSRAPLPGGLEATVRYGALSIGPLAVKGAAVAPVRIDAPGRHPLPGGGSLEVEAAAGAKWPLWWRTRLPGDRFRPARGAGTKKLKAWLIDRKVPREVRDGLVLLADDDGRVLWIPALDARAGNPSAEARLHP